MVIDTKIAEYVVPDSFYDSRAEDYEYLLAWTSPAGGWHCWLFEDFTRKKEINGEIVNTKTDNITKLFSNAFNSVSLVAENLTENKVYAIADILRAKTIRRYYKDNSFDELSIITDRLEIRKSDFRYTIEIEVSEKESNILK